MAIEMQNKLVELRLNDSMKDLQIHLGKNGYKHWVL